MTQPSTLEGIKKAAKKAAKAARGLGLVITHSQALEQVSKLAGYQNYHHAQKHLSGQVDRPPARSLSHIKKVATALRREAKAANQVLTRHDALDLVARKYGYENYQAARAALPENDPAPQGQY